METRIVFRRGWTNVFWATLVLMAVVAFPCFVPADEGSPSNGTDPDTLATPSTNPSPPHPCMGILRSEIPPALCDEKTGAEQVVVAPDWKIRHPFSARFDGAEPEPGNHVIDLKAIRFQTDSLVSWDDRGQRVFLEPDLSSFPKRLVSEPFRYGPWDYFIVQAYSPADQVALRDWIEGEGMAILDYIPQDAYLLRLCRHGLERTQERPEVMWVGQYQSAFRVNPKLDYIIESAPGYPLKMTGLFDRVWYGDESDLAGAVVVPGLRVIGLSPSETGWIVRFEGDAAAARDVAALPGCLWVDRFVDFELMNNVARTSATTPTGRGSQAGPIMDVEDVWARGIRGEGQIASAADSGLSTGNLATLHRDFGQKGSSSNPLRVIKGYALGRSVWDDNQSIDGGHGTHTSGSIVGNGVRSGSSPSSNSFPTTCFAGTAPKAQFVFQSVMDASGGLGGIPYDLNVLFQGPYSDGARVHSNSWGASTAGEYNWLSQAVDQFVWNSQDMVITFAAGNEGDDAQSPYGVIDRDSIGSPATAKNCITVGATENYRPDFVYEAPEGDCTGDGYTQQAWGWGWPGYATDPIRTDLAADDASGMGAFSSRGPCDDGRVKPDIVAPGIAIISTRTDKNQAYEQWGICPVPANLRDFYVSMGGTSMANPLAAGTAVLVRQYYKDGWHANDSQATNTSPVGGHGFNPSAALVKATLINGAWDMNPGQYGTGSKQEIPPSWDTGRTLPNNAEGFGRVDLEHSLFPGSGWGDVPGRALEVHDVAAGLATGQSKTYTVNLAGGANPLIVTLVWTDPYGAVSASKELVNDLDLTVTAPDGTVYYPNGLNKTSGADHTNNVEQVKVTSPAPCLWTIHVAGTSVPGNGQSGSTAQPYALVLSGLIGSPPGPPEGLTATAAAGQVTLSWSAGSPPGTSYNIDRASGACPGTGSTRIAAGFSGTTYPDTAVGPGRGYAYTVTSVRDGCESAPSPCASVKTPGTCSGAPAFAGLGSVTPVSGTSCALKLDWPAATAACDGPVVYSIYRSPTDPFTPGPSSRIATGVIGATYTDGSSLAMGTPYYYIVRATDLSTHQEDGNLVIHSGTTAGTGTPFTVYSSDFETGSGMAGWATFYFSPATNTYDWRGIQTCTAHSGSKIYRFGGTSCTAHYSDGANSAAVPGGTAGLQIPPDAKEVRLSFWHRWDFEEDFDGAFVRISFDKDIFYYVSEREPGVWLAGPYNGAVNYPTGERHGWTGASEGYPTAFAYTEMDLDASVNYILDTTTGAAGRTLWIAFSGYADGTLNSDGWYLDDVAVTCMKAAASCTPYPSIAVTSVDNTSCPAVKVVLTVTDAAGSAIPGLPSSAFTLSEDGSSQAFYASALGGGNYQVSYTTSKQDGQLHALDLSLSYGGYVVHTLTSMSCTPPCSVTCAAIGPAAAPKGQSVNFSATATASFCNGSPAYQWTFGDGGTSTSQNPSHTYTSAGSYTWSLAVTAGGVTCTKGGSISIVNPPVIAVIKKVAPPFKFVVTGSNFQPGIKVLINQAEWTSVIYKNTGKIQLTGSTLKATVPKGIPATFTFLNPDGGSADYPWHW